MIAPPSITIPVSQADLADLEQWAHNSEHTVTDLLQEALRHYMEYIRGEHAMYDEARKGPFYTMEEVRARLADRRRHAQAPAQAAE